MQTSRRVTVTARHGAGASGARGVLAAGLIALVAAALVEPAQAQVLARLDDGHEQQIEATLRLMSVEEKIGQLLMVGFHPGAPDPRAGADAAHKPRLSRRIERLVDEFHVGSVILFEYNIPGMRGDPSMTVESREIAKRVAQLTNALQDLAQRGRRAIPLLVAVDQEGGRALVIEKGVTLLPSAMAIGATRSEAYAYDAGRITAVELASMGIHVNLAPVADINTNKANDIIGDRSFGGHEELVARLSYHYMEGLHDGGVLSVAKHFPGHGDSERDPHCALPRVDLGRSQIETRLVHPFERLIDGGVDGVMPAHMYIPELEQQRGVPISLSPTALRTLLRQRLGFQGIILTDDLVEMRAVRNQGFSQAQIARLAVEAGNDVLMYARMPHSDESTKEECGESTPFTFDVGDLVPVVAELEDYFSSNPAQLDESVRRVLRAKLRAKGSLAPRDWRVDPERAVEVVRSRDHLARAREIANAGITLVSDPEGHFAGGSGPLAPLPPSDPLLVVAPAFAVDDLTPEIRRQGRFINVETIKLKYGKSRSHKLSENEIKSKAKAIAEGARAARMVIFGLVDESHVKVLERVLNAGVDRSKLIAIAFHEPNLLNRYLATDLTYLAAYSNLSVSNQAVVGALMGKFVPKSRRYLPVEMHAIHEFPRDALDIEARITPFLETIGRARAASDEGRSQEARDLYNQALELAQTSEQRVQALAGKQEAERALASSIPVPPLDGRR